MTAGRAALRPLPVVLPALRDELLSSWLSRHAVFYGVYGGQLLRRCWQAIEARISTNTTKPVAKSFWTNLALWRWSTAGFATAAAALALWIAVTPAPRPSLVAILHPPQQDQASWIATAGPSGLVLRAVTSATPPSGRAFELWAIAPGATQPRSLGVISPNGELKVPRLPVDLRDGATLAISIEPIGSSPTRLPSGPVVYIGSVKAV